MSPEDRATELVAFRVDHPDLADIPDERAPDLFVYQVWALGYRMGRLYRASVEAMPAVVRKHFR